MENYAVFLRGVNVGGNNIINMNDLKNVLISKKFINVKTYINSGNIVLKYEDNKAEVKEVIKKIIQSQFKMTIEMIVFTQKEIDLIIKNAPYNDKENDNSKKIIVMTSDKIDRGIALQFKNDLKIEENFYCIDDILYIYYHNGSGKSKFTLTYIEKKLNVTATGRNWNTIIRMSEMMKEE